MKNAVQLLVDHTGDAQGKLTEHIVDYLNLINSELEKRSAQQDAMSTRFRPGLEAMASGLATRKQSNEEALEAVRANYASAEAQCLAAA